MTSRNYLATTLAVACTFVLFGVCSGPSYAVTRDDALAARWKMGEEAVIGGATGAQVLEIPDATGNSENTLVPIDPLNLLNDPQRVPGFNPGGFATHFDGGRFDDGITAGFNSIADELITANNESIFDFGEEGFSISFWTKVDDNNDPFVKFYAARDPTNDQLFAESEIFFELGGPIDMGFGMRDGAPGGDAGVGFFPEEFDFDDWHLLTFVRDKQPGVEGTVTLYHNGVNVGEEADNTGDLTIPGPFGVGGENGAAPDINNPINNPQSSINAILDEFRLYNVALTPEEVEAIYNNGEGDLAAPSDLLFLWGNRTATGSWGVSGGWESQDISTEPPGPIMNTAEIPMIGQEISDPVQVLSGTVAVDTDQGAWSLQIDDGAGVEVASGVTLLILQDVTTAANSTIALAGTLNASTIDAQGTVTFADGVLAVGGGTIAAAATSSDATIQNSADLSVGQMTVGDGDALVKQSGGTLILDQSGGANSFAAGSSINVEAGAVAGVNDLADNALGSAAVNLDGGNLVLSSSEAGAAAFDVAVAVNSDAVIGAAQIGAGALADESVTLGGTNGVSLAVDVEATLETADGYTLNLAGDVAGDGQLSFASGARVNVTGAVTAKVVQFQGDTSGVTGIGNVAPGEAYLFAPIDDTPEMSIGFAIGGDADVIVEGQVEGSVELAGTANYTGTTRIVRGTLRTGGGGGGVLPDGDYNGNEQVEQADLDLVLLNWGSQIPPDAVPDGWVYQQPTGKIDQNDLDGVLLNWGDMASGGPGLPAASLLQFAGASPGDLAVLESADATFERNIGAGAGEVTWAGSGGFASKGGAGGLTVTLEGDAELSFSSADAGFNGHALQLGSPSADGKVTLTNDLNLENAEGVVQIADNPDSDQDFVEISGVVSSTAGGADVLTVTAENGEETFQNGLLFLSAQNSMSKLRIVDASVAAEPGVGLPAGANLEFGGNAEEGRRPAVWVGSGTVNRNIGSAAGEASWDGSGGFGARGADLTVTLEGGATLAWESADNGFNGAPFQLGSNHADAVTTFTNSVTGFNGEDNPELRFIKTFGNPFSESDEIHIEGDFVDGFAELLVDGVNSRVVFNGDITVSLINEENENVGFFGARESITLLISDQSAVSVGRDAGVFDSASVFVNTEMFEVAGGMFVEGEGSSLGGDGKLSVGDPLYESTLLIAEGSFLRPGPDFDAVGTLEVVLEEPGIFDDIPPGRLLLLNGATYEMEFINDGGLQHDSVSVEGALPGDLVAQIQLGEGEGDLLNLELDALNDVSGLVSADMEFDLFVWNDLIDLLVNGENISLGLGGAGTGDANFALSSTDFSGGTVQYEIFSDFSGRVFVTGLTPAAVSASAAVPEPASWVLAAIALVRMVACRRRRKHM